MKILQHKCSKGKGCISRLPDRNIFHLVHYGCKTTLRWLNYIPLSWFFSSRFSGIKSPPHERSGSSLGVLNPIQLIIMLLKSGSWEVASSHSTKAPPVLWGGGAHTSLLLVCLLLKHICSLLKPLRLFQRSGGTRAGISWSIITCKDKETPPQAQLMQTNINGAFFPSPSSCKCIINLSSNLHVWSVFFRLQMCLKEGEDPVIWSVVPGIGSVFARTEPHAQSWSGVESSQLAALGQQGSGSDASQAGLQELFHSKTLHSCRAPMSSEDTQSQVQEPPADKSQSRSWPSVMRPFEPPLPQRNRNQRRRDEGWIHFKQGNFHLKCWLESNPPQQHFVPLTSVYQFLLTRVSWLRDKKAQPHWY